TPRDLPPRRLVSGPPPQCPSVGYLQHARRPAGPLAIARSFSMQITYSTLGPFSDLVQFEQLVALGHERGWLELHEVHEALGEADLYGEAVEEAVAELEAHGIELRTEGEAQAPEAAPASVTYAPSAGPSTVDPLQLFLTQIGRSPLLTKQQEVELAKR